MAGFIPLLQDYLVDRLTADCIAAIAEDDPARLEVVLRDAYQEDPTEQTAASVYHQHPEDKGWLDEVDKSLPGGGFEIGSGSIGGRFMVRRFSVRAKVYFVDQGYTKDQASDYAGQLLARMDASLSKSYPVLTDELGEKLQFLKDIDVKTKARGGDGSWLYDFWFRLEFSTYIPPR